jgi:hypothetical protein
MPLRWLVPADVGDVDADSAAHRARPGRPARGGLQVIEGRTRVGILRGYLVLGRACTRLGGAIDSEPLTPIVNAVLVEVR